VKPEPLTPEAADIAAALSGLKQLDFDSRYDIYAELFREGWATDIGYALLPALWASIAGVTDRVDAEVAYVIGSIQRSFLDDHASSAYLHSAGQFVSRDCLLKTIDRLRSSARFCNETLPLEHCQELIAGLSERCST
jgi:hypothetical protein